MSLFPLNIKVELLLNNTWTDISDFVYQRDTMTITGGATASGDTNQPASINITLNNRDGRFSPNYASGAYYPYLARNNQIRVSVVNATSSSGNTYSGYRFWGKVADWPPQSDVSGHDVFVSITANGPLREIHKGGGKGSALTRYYQSLTGQWAPIAYWPCEEDPDSQILGAGIDGGTDMSVISGMPKWKSVSNFNGSAPIAVVNNSTWEGQTGSFGASGDDVYTIPGTYTWVASTSTVDCRVWGAGGGATKGQEGNGGGAAGGGGEFAREATLAVTPGQGYQLQVGTGGAQGDWNAGGLPGTASWFQGDTVLVYANPGGGAQALGSPGGYGGSGSTNSVHYNGGHGGNDSGSYNQGAGGGSSAGTGAAGTAGGNSSFGTPGAGGVAPAGGGNGGKGGNNQDGKPGSIPGGGGGGGWADNTAKTYGGPGAPGKVELIYTGSGGGTEPSNVVLRFILWTPAHGGNPGKVLVRAIGAGAVHQLDVQYRNGGSIRLLGYNSTGGTLFDSGNLAVNADGQALMVSAELADAGANINWALSAIVPGANGVVNKASGTLSSAAMGSVTQVYVAPNGDVTKSAVGHISLQYALIPLWKVSQHLNGHDQEMGIDRFIRLCTEKAMSSIALYSEGSDHWGFESGTQSWTALNSAIAQSTTAVAAIYPYDYGWPADGTHSLKITASGGSGSWGASSPGGTSGQPIVAQDRVAASADIYAPAGLGAVELVINWWTAAGAANGTVTGTPVAPGAGDFMTVSAHGIAPAGTAYFSVTVQDAETRASGTVLYLDNVRVHPMMGIQEVREHRELLEEIKDLDQGMMKEAKILWGLGYRTRISLINQSPALTLDYSAGEVVPPLAPVFDNVNVKNDITVKRHKGSKVNVQLLNGAMSVQEPPGGTGRFKKIIKAVAAADEQLLALATHLLNLGTVSDERYPTISVNLARAGIAHNATAPLMSAMAGIEIGDYIKVVNLPFWFPSATVKQLVIGYTETLNAYEWTITWNCTPESPYEITATSLRRW